MTEKEIIEELIRRMQKRKKEESHFKNQPPCHTTFN